MTRTARSWQSTGGHAPPTVTGLDPRANRHGRVTGAGAREVRVGRADSAADGPPAAGAATRAGRGPGDGDRDPGFGTPAIR